MASGVSDAPERFAEFCTISRARYLLHARLGELARTLGRIGVS